MLTCFVVKGLQRAEPKVFIEKYLLLWNICPYHISNLEFWQKKKDMFLQITPFSPVCIATEIAILLHWPKWNKPIIPVMALPLDIMSGSFFKGL